MRLTVLGCYGPYPTAGQCCSGYLLQDDKTSLLLDCGNGVLSRLRYFLEPWDLDAIILSHLHSDHISDLMILRYAIMIRSKAVSLRTLPVYAPGEPTTEFARLSYKKYLKAHPVTSGTTLNFGTMHVTFTAAIHPYPSFLITVDSGGKKLVYTGDTEYYPAMADAVRGADLFLCEANYLRSDIERGYKNHMAAYQSAIVARDAGVGRLVLTHHHPEGDLRQTFAEAAEIFPNVELAKSGSFYLL